MPSPTQLTELASALWMDNNINTVLSNFIIVLCAFKIISLFLKMKHMDRSTQRGIMVPLPYEYFTMGQNVSL